MIQQNTEFCALQTYATQNTVHSYRRLKDNEMSWCDVNTEEWLVEALYYKPEGPGLDSQYGHGIFQMT
jgi:hypothetical protein